MSVSRTLRRLLRAAGRVDNADLHRFVLLELPWFGVVDATMPPDCALPQRGWPQDPVQVHPRFQRLMRSTAEVVREMLILGLAHRIIMPKSPIQWHLAHGA